MCSPRKVAKKVRDDRWELETEVKDLTFEGTLQRLQTKKATLKDTASLEEDNDEEFFIQKKQEDLTIAKGQLTQKECYFKYKMDTRSRKFKEGFEKPKDSLVASEQEKEKKSSQTQKVRGERIKPAADQRGAK